MEVRPITTGGGGGSGSGSGGSIGRGVGLFAIQQYKAGDCIIAEETPLIRLAPSSDEQESVLVERVLQQENDNIYDNAKSGDPKDDRAPKLLDMIIVPDTVPKEHVGKFKGMVQAGLLFLRNSNTMTAEDKKQLSELYHPVEDGGSNRYEREIIRISKLAAQYVMDHTNDSDVTSATLEEVALVWSCNSFEGGRIYSQISRINHSCNPNAMIQANRGNDEQQSVVAISAIQPGEEITISYLGIFIYADRPARQTLLQSTKHFTCACSRCQKEEATTPSCCDAVSLVPCPTCHPRMERSQQLDEDTQYDDEQNVSYVSARSISAEGGKQVVVSCDKCRATTTSGSSAPPPPPPAADCARLATAMRRVREKAIKFLQDRQQAFTTKTTPKSGVDDEEEEDEEDHVRADLLDQHLRLASSIMGARHWTTNLVLLLRLDDTLKSIHSECLLNDATPDMTVLAEAIDMLERLVRFVDEAAAAAITCDHAKGHLLSNAMIGAARALVGLGDIKSQTYAAEWVEPIREYVRLFESPGIQRVVEAIANAHKTTSAATTNNNNNKKKNNEESPPNKKNKRN